MTTKSLGKRHTRAAALAAALVAALGLTACGSSTDTSSSSSSGAAQSGGQSSSAATGGGGGGEQVELTLGIQTQTNQKKPYSTMVAAFEQANPNIKVNVVETPNENFGSLIKTQFQAGNAPDVIYGSPGSGNANSLLPYAKAGYLLPLTDQKWAVDSVPESAKTLYYQDDKLWALPLDVAPITWDINQAVFDKLQLKYPANFDEVVKACATARAGGVPLIQLAGSLVPNTGIMSLQIAASRVYKQDPEWNEKRAAKQVTFAGTQGWKDTLQTVIDMHDQQCFQDGAEAGTFDDLFSTVAAGGAASLFAPAGVVSDLNALNPSSVYNIIAFPGKTADDTFVFASPSNALGINAATTHQAEALKLLEYFAQPQTQDAFVALTGNVSLNTVLKGGQAPAAFSNVEKYLTDPKLNAPLANLFWPNGEVYNQLGTGVQGLLTGQTTIDDILAAMDQAYDTGTA